MKFCANCGSQMYDEQKCCANCGFIIPEVMQNTVYKQNKKAPVKLIVILIVSLVALIGFGILGFVLFGKPYEKPIKDIFELVNDKEESYCKYGKYFMIEKELEFEELEEDIFGDTSNVYEFIELLEKYFGDDYEISYKIKGADKLDKDDLEDYEDEFKDDVDAAEENFEYYEYKWEKQYNAGEITNSEKNELTEAYKDYIDQLDDIDITAGYEVDFEVIITGDEDFDFKVKNIAVLKINGKWLAVDMFNVLDETYERIIDEFYRN